ncbi:MAG: DUF1045 domain-containing protein [Hyphomicrobiales bacterium]|nr:MAG: DUF1045 domain-containing protein [Hyphomicrobiales bacterium]
MTMVRPAGGPGRCARTASSGCAAATALWNRVSRMSRSIRGLFSSFISEVPAIPAFRRHGQCSSTIHRGLCSFRPTAQAMSQATPARAPGMSMMGLMPGAVGAPINRRPGQAPDGFGLVKLPSCSSTRQALCVPPIQSMPERFAIYYAPPTTSDLWERASRWLGRDPVTGPVPNDGIAGIDAARLTAITPSATRYGFHATLKAPFPLADGKSRAALEADLQGFSLRHGRVSLGPLELRLLDGFLALTPVVQSPALTAFAGRVVADFDAFRAPMSAAERGRRLQSNLSPYQIGLLDHYGYPYVMDQFLFHMTLTDRMDPATQETVIAAAAEWFAPVLGREVVLDRLSLYHEPESGAAFVRAADFPLSSEVKV